MTAPFLCFESTSITWHSPRAIEWDKHRVLHLCWEYPPEISGGLGVACAGLVSALEWHLRTEVLHPAVFGNRSDLSAYSYQKGAYFALKPEQWLERLLSGQQHYKGGYLAAVESFSFSVLASPLSRSATFLHTHDWHSALAAVALKRLYGIPFLLHLHSCELERVGLHAKNDIYALEQWAIEEAALVVCVSQQSADFVGKHYSIQRSKVSVVHNGASAVPEVRSSSPASPLRNTILFAARLCSQKAPELMLEIFRKVLIEQPNARLLIAGTGDYCESLRAVIDFCSLTNSVELLGHVPSAKMQQIYQRANILCLPSIAEPFGLVAVEAAEQGVEVLLSNKCGASEVLASARVLPVRNVEAWASEIVKILRAPSEAEHKKAASRSWQEAALEIIELYSRLT